MRPDRSAPMVAVAASLLPGAAAAAPRSPAEWLRDALPDSWSRPGFLLEYWQWAGLLLLAFAGVVIDRLVVIIADYALRRFLARSEVRLKRPVTRLGLRPLGLVFMASVWWAGIALLGLPDSARAVLGIAAKFVFVAAAVWAAYRMVDVLAAALAERAAKTETRLDDMLVPLLRRALKLFILAFGLVFIADNLDVNITSLVAGLGLGGLALALAAQDTVKNVFGSVAVLLDRSFQVGDWVIIKDVEGTVESIGFRSTRIRTFYDSMVTLPNALLLTHEVDNLGARRYRRWKTMVSITYDTSAEKIEAFCEGIRELVRLHPYTRKDYFHVYLNQFAASSLDVLVYVFHRTPDWATELRERHRLFLDIVRLARRLGVEFAFPTSTVHLKPEAPEGGPPVRPTDGEGAELGRREAHAIVTAALGDPPSTPPPVTP